ncbi:hypothetical protein Rs2_42626 [Raphanus sativus]|nr:hypothetical protein Rs2_42626 [Raphanus sativus]
MPHRDKPEPMTFTPNTPYPVFLLGVNIIGEIDCRNKISSTTGRAHTYRTKSPHGNHHLTPDTALSYINKNSSPNHQSRPPEHKKNPKIDRKRPPTTQGKERLHPSDPRPASMEL